MSESEPLLCETFNDRVEVTFNRPAKRNSLSTPLLERFHQVLDEVGEDEDIRTIIIRGQGGVFCTGMDLEEFQSGEQMSPAENPYMALLKRFASMDRIVISVVEGTVMAGGVGIVAASDLVYADSKATFSLSEALWGLLPAMVTPFLIRRVGFQSAYRLTLTTATIGAQEAKQIHLVDEVGDDISSRLQGALRRLGRVHPDTIKELKSYFREMWIIDERMEEYAVAELARLSKEPRIIENITNFVNRGVVPWE